MLTVIVTRWLAILYSARQRCQARSGSVPGLSKSCRVALTASRVKIWTTAMRGNSRQTYWHQRTRGDEVAKSFERIQYGRQRQRAFRFSKIAVTVQWLRQKS